MPDPDRLDPTASDSLDMLFQIAPGHEVKFVAEELRKAGVLVERELARARIVGGKVPVALVGKLERIPGVQMVRQADTFSLPPFDERIPQ